MTQPATSHLSDQPAAKRQAKNTHLTDRIGIAILSALLLATAAWAALTASPIIKAELLYGALPAVLIALSLAIAARAWRRRQERRGRKLRGLPSPFGLNGF